MKRSVVDECCLQACSYSQLESYCAPGPAKVCVTIDKWAGTQLGQNLSKYSSCNIIVIVCEQPASLGSLLQSMKGQRGGTGSRQTPVAPPASPTTTTVQPLYGSEVAAGDRRQSSEMLGGGSSRNRGNRPESPYFGNRPFFFVTPARVNPANVAVRKRKHWTTHSLLALSLYSIVSER